MNLDTPTGVSTDLPFAIYDAFTDLPYSGSQSAIVLKASGLSAESRVRIAREIGVPATSFVTDVTGNRITVQFFSTIMELPMCGHGTVCVITRLIDVGLLPCGRDSWHSAVLDLPRGEAIVEYRRNPAGRTEVMLDVAIARFTPASLDFTKLARLLGVEASDFAEDLSPEIATADFVHLCLPMRGLEAMAALRPDFAGLAAFCVANGVETIAAFSTEVLDTSRNLHVRDFCPAVGVPESAAAGTTNAALAGYLLRNGRVHADAEGIVTVRSEQGMELGRPSQVTSRIALLDGQITRLQVGGVASRIVDGVLNSAIGPT